jgi:hypothetical protein
MMSEVNNLNLQSNEPLLWATNASSLPTASPVAGTTKGFRLQGATHLHTYIQLDGATGATVSAWFYSRIAGLWFKGPSMVVTANHIDLLEVQGEYAVAYTIDAITGTGTVRVWAGYSNPG